MQRHLPARAQGSRYGRSLRRITHFVVGVAVGLFRSVTSVGNGFSHCLRSVACRPSCYYRYGYEVTIYASISCAISSHANGVAGLTRCIPEGAGQTTVCGPDDARVVCRILNPMCEFFAEMLCLAPPPLREHAPETPWGRSDCLLLMRTAVHWYLFVSRFAAVAAAVRVPYTQDTPPC